MTRERIEQAIKFATSNKKALQESSQAGCYYCKKIYDSSEVVECREQEETALCPKCAVELTVLVLNAPVRAVPTNNDN